MSWQSKSWENTASIFTCKEPGMTTEEPLIEKKKKKKKKKQWTTAINFNLKQLRAELYLFEKKGKPLWSPRIKCLLSLDCFVPLENKAYNEWAT